MKRVARHLLQLRPVQTLAQLSVVFVSFLSLSFAAGCGYTHTASAHDVACRHSKAGCSAQPNAPAQSTTTTAAVAPAPTTTTFLPPSQPPGTPTNQPAAFTSAPMAPPPSTIALGSGSSPDSTPAVEEPAPPPKPTKPASSKKARRAPAR